MVIYWVHLAVCYFMNRLGCQGLLACIKGMAVTRFVVLSASARLSDMIMNIRMQKMARQAHFVTLFAFRLSCLPLC